MCECMREINRFVPMDDMITMLQSNNGRLHDIIIISKHIIVKNDNNCSIIM